VFETCGPAKPADISLNIRSIFVRAGVGEPIIALIPKQLGDGRCNSSFPRRYSYKAAWAAGPALKIVAEFEQSLKKYRPIAPGTPDTYTPPK
jgi:hypothetical protein